MRLGLDIGGTNIKAVVLGKDQKVLYQNELPSAASLGPTAVRLAIRSAIRTARQIHEVLTIGVGCAGSIKSESGIVVNSPNFAAWSNVPLAEWIEQDHKISVSVHNDANCAAVAEYHLGVGMGTRNFVLLTFGTGIGGGIIVDGKLLMGSTGTGGELGHLSIKFDGRRCPCGNTGCFERYCSASTLREAFPHMAEEDVFQQAPTNPVYAHFFQEFFGAMKIAITGIANTFDPDCIALGGGLSACFGSNLDEIQSWVRQHAFPLIGKNIHVRICKLGNWAGAIGAALQAPI